MEIDGKQNFRISCISISTETNDKSDRHQQVLEYVYADQWHIAK